MELERVMTNKLTGILALVALMLSCLPMCAQSIFPFNSSSSAWAIAGTVIPGSSTLVYSQTTQVDSMVVANTSGSSISITLTDNSANCNSGVCQILPAVSIAANTTYTIALYGIVATGGVRWSATGTNAAHGWIRGRV